MSNDNNINIGFRRKSVLIVDDNKMVQMTLADIVKAAGFEPVLAASRKEAIDLCDRRAFDVAFVDKRLVEHDRKNQDGFAILRYIKQKNEGTYLALLTGYGEYQDAVQLSKDLGSYKPMSKNPESGTMEEEVRQVLNEAATQSRSDSKKGLSARLFCGNDTPGNWETEAHSLLKPSVGILGLMNLMDELAQTCSPLLERPEDNGIQRIQGQTMMAGLYWSRGIGDAVVILLAKEKVPEEIPKLDTWPDNLQFENILYQAKRKNLIAAIIKCAGPDHTEFTVRRSQDQ